MISAYRNNVDSWIHAAETGQVEAQYQAGLRFSTGQDGAPLDYVMAHKWLNLAAVRGSEEARRLRSELAGDMTRDEIAQAQKLAREWMSTHH
jgi:TPR repeat protein